MLVPGDAYPGKLFGLVLNVDHKIHINTGKPTPDQAEVLFNDGNVISITVHLLREVT